MTDSKYDPYDPYDPFRTQPDAAQPERYAPPAESYPPDTYRPMEAYSTEPDAHESLGTPEPLASTEPVPAMAGGAMAPGPMAGAPADPRVATESSHFGVDRLVEEIVAWLKTLASAAVYATLIVTFGFQVARVEGQSMAPTLADQDRLIVNKLAYRMGEPQVGDIVMLYYPLRPEK